MVLSIIVNYYPCYLVSMLLSSIDTQEQCYFESANGYILVASLMGHVSQVRDSLAQWNCFFFTGFFLNGLHFWCKLCDSPAFLCSSAVCFKHVGIFSGLQFLFPKSFWEIACICLLK